MRKAKKHTECAVPAGTPPKGEKKGFNFVCANLLFWCADSRFAEPRRSLKKVLIVAVRKCHCGGLNRGLRNLGSSRKGDGFILFALCKKNQKAHQRFANLWTPGTIQIAGRYMIVVKVTGVHQVTGNAENSSFPGIAGNDLNRCEVPALQRKDLERRLKEQLYSLVDSRLRDVAMGGGGWKRVVLGGNKERFVRIKGFWFAKSWRFLLIQGYPIKKKTFFSAQRHQLPTATKLTCNCKFHPRQPTVSLQYTFSFSKNNGLASALR